MLHRVFLGGLVDELEQRVERRVKKKPRRSQRYLVNEPCGQWKMWCLVLQLQKGREWHVGQERQGRGCFTPQSWRVSQPKMSCLRFPLSHHHGSESPPSTPLTWTRLSTTTSKAHANSKTTTKSHVDHDPAAVSTLSPLI